MFKTVLIKTASYLKLRMIKAIIIKTIKMTRISYSLLFLKNKTCQLVMISIN